MPELPASSAPATPVMNEASAKAQSLYLKPLTLPVHGPKGGTVAYETTPSPS